MNICFSISIAQHGEIIMIINSSSWSQNLSLRVRVHRVRVLKSHYCSYCSWPTIASIDFWSCFCSFIDKYIYLYFPPLQLKAILCLFNWETIQEKRNEWFSKYEMKRQLWLKSGFHKMKKIDFNVKILFSKWKTLLKHCEDCCKKCNWGIKARVS